MKKVISGKSEKSDQWFNNWKMINEKKVKKVISEKKVKMWSMKKVKKR